MNNLQLLQDLQLFYTIREISNFLYRVKLVVKVVKGVRIFLLTTRSIFQFMLNSIFSLRKLESKALARGLNPLPFFYAHLYVSAFPADRGRGLLVLPLPFFSLW